MLRWFLSHSLPQVVLTLLAISAITIVTLADDLTPAQGGKKIKSQTKITATAEKPGPDGKQNIIVVMEINSGWHAYANPVNNDGLKGAATLIQVKAMDKLASVQVNYPAGKLKKDKDAGDYHYYAGKVAIPVVVQRAKGDISPLEVSVRFMKCDDKNCLPIEQVKLTLP